MHFCDNELQSVRVYSVETPCCSDSNEKNEISDETLISSSKPCCETKRVDISTDNLQYQQIQQLNLSNLIPSIDIAWIVFDVIHNWLEQTTLTKVNLFNPPKGFDAKDLDILTFICILRI